MEIFKSRDEAKKRRLFPVNTVIFHAPPKLWKQNLKRFSINADRLLCTGHYIGENQECQTQKN